MRSKLENKKSKINVTNNIISLSTTKNSGLVDNSKEDSP